MYWAGTRVQGAITWSIKGQENSSWSAAWSKEDGTGLHPEHASAALRRANLKKYILFWIFFFFFKTQPYIPSRKAVYVVEHVEKRTIVLFSTPPKVLRVGKGSSIR